MLRVVLDFRYGTMDDSDIANLLDRLSELLRSSNESQWADACDHCRLKYSRTPSEGLRDILAMYGGMGSFNDIVLYGEDGKILNSKNDELAALRSALHFKCIAAL